MAGSTGTRFLLLCCGVLGRGGWGIGWAPLQRGATAGKGEAAGLGISANVFSFSDFSPSSFNVIWGWKK